MVASITESGLPVDWDYLRTEGLKHLQEMTGHLWTDYNIHDPGVTLFEALCYGIEELESRISQDIDTLLTDESGQLKERFFSPGAILTINPVTINDYRKLLIDMSGVRNAWLEPATDTDPDIYYDKDNNALLYDYATKATKIYLNGLHRVHIEREEDPEAEKRLVAKAWEALTDEKRESLAEDEWNLLTDDEKSELSADNWDDLLDEEKDLFRAKARETFYLKTGSQIREEATNLLRTEVRKKLYAHRNLCEDFEEVRIMEPEKIYLYTDIQIDENADADDVMGRIYYDLREFISPRIRQYGLKRMLKKGKSMEQIFNGPPLSNGFIDDDDLGVAQKRRELHTSDLIRIIMAHKEVTDVRKLFISNKYNPDPVDKQEWALVLDDTKALVLEAFNASRIQLFKNDALVEVDRNKVLSKVEALTEQADRDTFSESDALVSIQENTLIDLENYGPVGKRLPSNFGISDTGLPSTVSVQRVAQSRQLRGYLLFFEQILVNYLKQLDSFKHSFALKQNRDTILQTYFSKQLPDSLWNPDFPEIGTDYHYVEDDPEPGPYQDENAFARKNRILNHLLALFNEKFADYSIIGYKQTDLDQTLKKPTFLNIKADYLRNFPQLSQNKNRAYDILLGNSVQTNVDGLKNLIAAKVGFDAHETDPDKKQEFENFLIIEHVLLRPHGKLTLDFICSEHIKEEFQPDPYSYKLTFIIPKRKGRFQDASFKQLVYNTIGEETPAHIIYNVLEFDNDQLIAFNNTFKDYLEELRIIQTNESGQYNTYRNVLIELLGIGRIKLPVLHLDAADFNGDGIPDYDFDKGTDKDDESDDDSYPTDGAPIDSWFDLSRNDNHAEPVGASKATYVKNDPYPPYLRFDGSNRFEIAGELFKNSFTVVVVFKAVPSSEGVLDACEILTAESNGIEEFSVSMQSDGTIVVKVNKDELHLDSTLNLHHILVFSGDKETGELNLTIDGELHQFDIGTSWDLPMDFQGFRIGPGNGTYSCDYGEIIVLDSVLPWSRKRKLEDYLSEKWRVPLSIVQSIHLPRLHLDANRLISVISDNTTGLVSKWEDLSENRIHAIQSSIPLRPIYDQSGLSNRPSIKLDGTDAMDLKSDDLALLNSNFTIALIYKTEKSEGQLLTGLVSDSSGISSVFDIGIGKMGAIRVNVGSESLVLASTTNETHLIVATGKLNNGKLDVDLFLDGKSSTDLSFENASAFSLGSKLMLIGDKFSGDIAEIVFFDSAFSTLERQRLEDFLSKKWKIDTTGVNSITKPVVHLDAARLTTITEEASKIAHWRDISPHQNHAVQDTEERRPVFLPTGLQDKGAVHFTQIESPSDSYDDSLIIKRTIQDDFTIFIIFRPDAAYYKPAGADKIVTVEEGTQWTEGVALIDADCSGTYNDFGISIGKKAEQMIVMAGVGDRITKDHTIHSKELQFDKINLITFNRRKADGEVKLFANGLLHATADLADDARLNDARLIKIGAFNSEEGVPYRGDIGEVIILDHVLSNEKQQLIERYLAHKWLITIQRLPVDISNLWLHFDANERATVVTDNDYKIVEWEDTNNLSFLAASQGEATLRPHYMPDSMNGLPGIRFNNTYLGLEDTNSVTASEFTIVVVFNALSWGNTHPDWKYGAALIDNFSAGHPDSGFGIATRHDPVTNSHELLVRIGESSVGGAFPLQNPHIAIIEGNADNGNIHLYIDGLEPEFSLNLDRSVNLTPINRLTIGATHVEDDTGSRGYFHGDLSEVIYLRNRISTTDRQILERHLSQKWRIDISGINSINKPVFHLDASKLNSVVWDSADKKVEKWLDKNGLEFTAIQHDVDKRPTYINNDPTRLPVLRFSNSSLTFPQMVQEDFTIVVVYKAESSLDRKEYMPVSRDAFTVLAGVALKKSYQIWKLLLMSGYIDRDGNVLPKFTPHEPDFDLFLDYISLQSVQTEVRVQISAIMTDCKTNGLPIPEEKFEIIGGINKTISKEIWNQLNKRGYINNYGIVKTILPADDGVINGWLEIWVKSSIINIIMADNWVEGVGLIDGNAPGERDQLYKRDFGLLIGKDEKIIGGMGVIGQDDTTIEADATKDQFHVVVMTRERASGLVSLTVDDNKTVTANIARGVTLHDSHQLTIGAVNTGGNYFKGDIGEIIILDKVLSEDDIRAVQHYLAGKWYINMPGLDIFAKPLFHLDAGKPGTVTVNPANKAVEQWHDVNQNGFFANQSDSSKCPVLVDSDPEVLPVIHFDNAFLTFPQVMTGSFSIAVVYKAEGGQNPEEFMPVTKNAFEKLAGATPQLSMDLWESLNNLGYINSNGDVQVHFTPQHPGFNLGLDFSSYQLPRADIGTRIINSLSEHQLATAAVPNDTFAAIGGINRSVSLEIWNQLVSVGHLDNQGNVHSIPTLEDIEFISLLNHVIDLAIIHIILANNWFEGVGLIDGNSPGDITDFYKRDFGILINKDEKLIGGFGVVGEADKKVEVSATKDTYHVAVLTRDMNSGLVTLKVDDLLAASAVIAPGSSLNDSQQFTIGAVNTGGNHFKGNIGEIIILDRAISESHVKILQRHLFRKWQKNIEPIQ